MTHFVLSPCLLKNEDGEFNKSIDALNNYYKILCFANEWLTLKLLIHENSLFNNLFGYMPPLEEQTLASFFQANIMPQWKTLIESSDIIFQFNDNDKIGIIDNKYKCVDETECNLIYLCLEYTKDTDVLMFVGEINSNESKVSIASANHNHFLHIVSNPFMEETDIFDNYLNCAESCEDMLFPCIDICREFVCLAYEKKERSSYVRYGDIIARRNGFKKLPYNANHYKEKVPSYRSCNGKFYISLDELHGTFEVFDATKRNAPYIGEYSFNGEHVKNKTSTAETHKFFK